MNHVREDVVVVQMQDIVKRFGSLVANDHINLTVHQGEVHGLLGENGAGKTTLMNVLYGLLHAESGTIEINGKPVHISGPSDAIRAGIGMVHQHFMLVQPFTVTQNIILGMEPVQRGAVLDMRTARKKVLEISQRYGLAIDPDARIRDITVGMQQRVEILKALYRGADILILDEPTAVLTPQEIQDLMGIIDKLTEQGKTVIIITHKLAEIKKAVDYCTVIRRGVKIDTVKVADVTQQELATMMVGREVSFQVEKKPARPQGTCLEVRNLSARDARGLPALKNVSLRVRKGEILGIAGVDGNGQNELVEVLAGLRKSVSGKVLVGERDVTNLPPAGMLAAGVGCIPQDRQRHGLVMPFTLAENMILEKRARRPFCKRGLLNRSAITQYASRLMEEFDVRPRDPERQARQLSGGNQQKSIIARIINNDPEVLIAVQPTRGLDVGAIEFVHKALVAQRDAGRAVLLVSLELDEVIHVSDRIAVMYEGRVVGEVDAEGADEFSLGLMMAGGGKHDEA